MAFIDSNYAERGNGKIGWFGLFESEENKRDCPGGAYFYSGKGQETDWDFR